MVVYNIDGKGSPKWLYITLMVKGHLSGCGTHI